MTGFGEASAQSDGVHYFVEVRSLNSKFFKAVIRLPDRHETDPYRLILDSREPVIATVFEGDFVTGPWQGL